MMSRPLSIGILLAGLAAGASIGCEPGRSSARIRELDLPRGFVDAPLPGPLTAADVFVAGWAISADGIEDVSVYADGRYLDSAVLGFARPDVAAAEPAAPGASTSGFQLLIPPSKLPRGPVTLLVQARTRGGATRDLGVVVVVVPTPP
ncbi:MAG: hypothetical protein HY900_34805 [Deltaproteobacteria bacterium]|nr:hypothetical protein [Deltaproteobacteria bacterium]